MTYAIVRHKILDINIVLKKGLIYSILITILTLLYIVAALILENKFRGLIGYRSLPITILTIAIIVLLFQPLKNYVQHFVDKYFFHGSIDQINEENIRLREELQKSEKLKAVATLAAGMAHEIKNPLTSIKTFTEYLDRKKNDPGFIEKFASVVPEEVNRINTIVRQLLEFSKPGDLHLESADINSLLDDTLSLLNNDLLRHNIRLVRECDSLPSVKVDPSQIKQAFLNLLLNAIDEMGSGGRLTVRTETVTETLLGSNEHVVRLVIADTGEGIADEDLSRVFDPFFSTKDHGTGLGLSVVHGIIENHGGKISVKSELSKGTEFTLHLPVG